MDSAAKSVVLALVPRRGSWLLLVLLLLVSACDSSSEPTEAEIEAAAYEAMSEQRAEEERSDMLAEEAYREAQAAEAEEQMERDIAAERAWREAEAERIEREAEADLEFWAELQAEREAEYERQMELDEQIPCFAAVVPPIINLYVAPRVSSTVLAEVTEGEYLDILAGGESGDLLWVQVYHELGEGWALLDQLREIGNCDDIPVLELGDLGDGVLGSSEATETLSLSERIRQGVRSAQGGDYTPPPEVRPDEVPPEYQPPDPPDFDEELPLASPPPEQPDWSPGDLDCEDFGSHDEAQQFYDDHGGLNGDWRYLDGDGDGSACEWGP